MERIPSSIGEPVDPRNIAAVAGSRLPILEIIATAAQKRLLVQLAYDGESGASQRDVEAYALRQAKNGRLYLLAVDHSRNGEVRNFRFDRIRQASISTVSFQPRFEIEFGEAAPEPKLPTKRKAIVPLIRKPADTTTAHRTDYHPRTRGLVFTVICPFCGRRFTEALYRTALTTHPTESGAPCEGRHGFPV